MENLQQTSRNLLVCDQSSLRHRKCRLSQQVQQHHFNHQVSLLLPECGSAPPPLDAALRSFSSSYLLRKLPLHELLDTHFLQDAVYQGSVYGLSYRSRIDEDTCVALLPSGQLVLSLDKDVYERLGVEGKPSRFNQRANSRYVVTVNLTDSSMAPGGRGYQRLLTGLKSRVQLQTDFLLSHHPGGGEALKALLSRYDWTEHRPQVSSRLLTNLPCPTPLTSDLPSCDPHSFLEWLGAVEAEVSCDNESTSFLSTLVCPEPRAVLSRALRVRVSGLLLPQDVYRLIEELRRCWDGRGTASWAALTVQGFADSPVSWGSREHGFLKGGENFYSLLLCSDHSYWLCMGTGAHDGCPP
ncbi:ribonuclease P protein subunit p40 [Myripristis murdjan]|nr:ribonuclease P protein subunit p40 [Myripristis murdjan]XP_029930014.1 ribonuclease P protein subunit p40 [Myripristis murdjan]